MSYTNVTKSYRYYQYYKVNGVLNSVNRIVAYSAIRSGSKVDNWKEKIQKGLDATSSYSTSAMRIDKQVMCYVRVVAIENSKPTIPIIYVHEGLTYNVPDVVHITNTTAVYEAAALSKIIKKVKASRQSLNGFTVLGELTKTIHGLRHPFQLLREQVYAHLTTVNKRNRGIGALPPAKRKKAWRDIVSSTWLETNFGLRPVISDVRDIAEGLARFQFDEPKRVSLHSKSDFLDKTSGKVANLGTSDPPYTRAYSADWTRETRTFCSYAVGYEQTCRPKGSISRLQQVLGFDLENFVPTLYEIMPWSWLIDYFSNIGEIIEAGTVNTEGVKWISKTTGQITKEIWQCNIDYPRMSQYFASWAMTMKSISGDTHFGRVEQSKATVTRTRPASLGVPALQFSIPGKPMQIANILAICGQLSGRVYDPMMGRNLMAKYPLVGQK